jgi:hypothetical protein
MLNKLVAKNNRGASRRTGKRNGSRRNGSSSREMVSPDPRGDLPRRPKRTYSTSSVALPKTTQECTFRQTAVTQLFQSTSAVYGTIVFKLSNVPGYSNLAIWDQYRLDAVRISIVPTANALPTTVSSTQTYSELYCVIDYDDSVNLTSTTAALGYDNCIMLVPGESLERTFQPRIAVAGYAGTFTSYTNMPPQWIDTASNAVQHYGLKYAISPGAAGQTAFQTWDVITEYFISFRSLLS